MSAEAAAAEDIRGFVQVGASRNESETELSTGESSRQETFALVTQFNFTWDRQLFPNFRILAGGQFDRDDVNTRFQATGFGDLETDTATRRLRPFVQLLLNSEIFKAEVTWNYNERNTDNSAGSVTKLAQNRYTGVLGWFPVELPSVALRYEHTEDFDDDRAFRDRTRDLLQLTSEYRPVQPLYLLYRGALEDSEDRLTATTVDRTVHNGRVSYADILFDQRWNLTSDYNFNHAETTTTTTGRGEVGFPLFPIAGLSSVDETPEDGTLGSNPALIDGDLAASTGINLGLPPLVGDDRPRNIGLDFGVEAAVNTLLLWVDRDLPPEISDSYTWQVWTSSDNLEWFQQESVTAAPFGPFAPRFEIRFNEVRARYVKVVTDPLSQSVPGSQSFPAILVTELDAERRVPSADVDVETSTTSHFYSMSSRLRIVEDKPALFYELSLNLNKLESVPTTYTLSNGLILTHAFSDVYSVTARVAREDGKQTGFDRVGLVYSASLSIVPMQVLRYNVLVSGRNEDVGGLRNLSNSVFFYAIAEPYRGFNFNLGLGKGFDENFEGQESETTTINFYSSITPHRTVGINLIYNDRFSDVRDPVGVRFTRSDSVKQVSLSYRPVRTIYLFGSYRLEDRPTLDDRTTTSYAVNWSPFPGGRLRFNLGYNETQRTESDFDTTESTIVPSLRWDITGRSFLDIAYRRTSNRTTFQRSEIDTISGVFRFGF